MPLPIAEGFVASAQAAADLVTRPEVRDRWDLESSCAGMTNGGLANHLADQTGTRAAPARPPNRRDLAPIPVREHYRRASWVHSGLGDEPNTGIRDGSNEQAAGRVRRPRRPGGGGPRCAARRA